PAAIVCARNRAKLMTGDTSIETSAAPATEQRADALREPAAPAANSAASPAPCQMKCTNVQPSVRKTSGEIQFASVLIDFSPRTRPEDGAAHPALPWTFAGPPARGSSIRLPSPQTLVAARPRRVAVSSRSPAGMLHKRVPA